MKKIMLTIAALVVSSTSHALIADRIKCSIEVRDLETMAKARAEKEFFIARLPMSANPGSDIRMTAGATVEALTLETKKGELRADLNFYYKHAIKADANGTSKARQHTCIGLTGSFCPKSDGGGLQICNHGAIACAEPEDPFDPIYGWSEVSIIGGMPTFKEQTLAPQYGNITDDSGNEIGITNVNCQYKGSYQ